MTITLYINSSDTNVVDKSLYVVATLTGSLRDSCSVTDPVVTVEYDNLSSINYMWVEEFSRYYFITEIVCVRTGLWALKGHVDVLMTYRDNIRSIGAIIARNESPAIANFYLDDDRLQVTCRRDFQLITFPNRVVTGGDAFVLTVAGGAGTTSS